MRAGAGGLSLSPRRGARPSPELHLAPWRRLLRSSRPARSFSRVTRPLTPSQRPARRQQGRQERRHGRRLPGSSAGSRGGGAGGCSCSRRTLPPLSPYRTRGSDCALALRPAAAAAAPSRGEARRGEAGRRAGGQAAPARGEGGPGRKCAGRRRREGAGSRPGGSRRRPSLLSRTLRGHQRKHRPLTARPSWRRCTRTTPPSSTPAAARSARPAGRG